MMKTQKSNPAAVLISDIHFTPATLELASEALIAARDSALNLGAPLVIAGDTLDTKAIIRGECANRLIDILATCQDSVKTYLMVGNHDLLNEKGKDHSLRFLEPYVTVVAEARVVHGVGTLVPYQSDLAALQAILDAVEGGSRLIMHQGVQTAFLGHYVQDKTSLPPSAFANFRVVSGHYHRHQDIKCGPVRKGAVGLFSYIGNPYTLTFGEAEDGPKGYQILNDDGTLTPVPLNLRKHMVIVRSIENLLDPVPGYNPGDVVWLKVSGPDSALAALDKKEVGEKLFGTHNYKLDLIRTDTPRLTEEDAPRTDHETLDLLIDRTDEPMQIKAYLKNLWRRLL